MLRNLLIVFMLLPAEAKAQSIKIELGLGDVDFAFKFGAMVGSIQSDENRAAGTQKFGGIVGGGIFSFDRSASWTLFVSPEGTFDALSKSIVRKGAQAGFIYHLLGGSKKVFTPLFNATLVTSFPASLGLVLKSSYFEYSVVDPNKLIPATKGSVSENSVGFDFRYDLDSGSSLGAQLSAMFLSVPTSSEGLKTSGLMEIFSYWRWAF